MKGLDKEPLCKKWSSNYKKIPLVSLLRVISSIKVPQFGASVVSTTTVVAAMIFKLTMLH